MFFFTHQRKSNGPLIYFHIIVFITPGNLACARGLPDNATPSDLNSTTNIALDTSDTPGWTREIWTWNFLIEKEFNTNHRQIINDANIVFIVFGCLCWRITKQPKSHQINVVVAELGVVSNIETNPTCYEQ